MELIINVIQVGSRPDPPPPVFGGVAVIGLLDPESSVVPPSDLKSGL